MESKASPLLPWRSVTRATVGLVCSTAHVKLAPGRGRLTSRNSTARGEAARDPTVTRAPRAGPQSHELRDPAWSSKVVFFSSMRTQPVGGVKTGENR